MAFSIFVNIVLILAAVITYAVYWVKKRYSFWKDAGVLCLKPTFPTGNMSGIGSKVHVSLWHQQLYNQYKGQTPFLGTYTFLMPTALAMDLDFIKNIIVKDFHYFQDRGFYNNEKDDPLSAHLFSLEGPKWKGLRAKLTPTFTSGKMKYMFPTIVSVGDRLEKKLSQLIETEVDVDIKNLFGRFTMDVIGISAFGIECNSLFGETMEFYKMGLRSFSIPRHSMIEFIFLCSIPKLARALRIKFNHDDVSEFFLGVMRSTINLRKTENIKRNDFTDILLKMMREDDGCESDKETTLTFNEVTAQAFIFFLAGFETSSTLMSFCLYELSQDLTIQEKLRAHVLEVLEAHNGEFTYDAMMDMKYLDQVLHETLRKYPPVANLVRVATKDYIVPGTNICIPVGNRVLIPAYAIQRDKDIYPDPDKFDPERFSEEQSRNRHPCAFLAFGEGPRNCIGLRFGMMQARIGMVAILRNYSFSLSKRTISEMPMKFDMKKLILCFERDIFLNFEKLK